MFMRFHDVISLLLLLDTTAPSTPSTALGLSHELPQHFHSTLRIVDPGSLDSSQVKVVDPSLIKHGEVG